MIRTGLATAAAREAHIRKGNCPVEKVRRAIKLGYTRQWAIHIITDLTVDEVSDCIAVLLLDAQEIKRIPVATAHLWHSDNWTYEVAA
jgi:hypothetical protein